MEAEIVGGLPRLEVGWDVKPVSRYWYGKKRRLAVAVQQSEKTAVETVDGDACTIYSVETQLKKNTAYVSTSYVETRGLPTFRWICPMCGMTDEKHIGGCIGQVIPYRSEGPIAYMYLKWLWRHVIEGLRAPSYEEYKADLRQAVVARAQYLSNKSTAKRLLAAVGDFISPIK
jgi:hypothetical protein